MKINCRRNCRKTENCLRVSVEIFKKKNEKKT